MRLNADIFSIKLIRDQISTESTFSIHANFCNIFFKLIYLNNCETEINSSKLHSFAINSALIQFKIDIFQQKDFSRLKQNNIY